MNAKEAADLDRYNAISKVLWEYLPEHKAQEAIDRIISIIAEALAEQDKEIARMREALKKIADSYIEKPCNGWTQTDANGKTKQMTGVQTTVTSTHRECAIIARAAIFPPATKEPHNGV